MPAPPAARAAVRLATRTPRLQQLSPRHRQLGIPSCRRYHSYDQPAPPGPFTKTEEALLASAYQHVPEHGFSPRALRLGARDAGMLDISPSVLPDGPFSLIRYHLVSQREGLVGRSEELFGEGMAPLGLEAKVEALTLERLMGNKDIIHQWQDALAVMAQPSYTPTSIRELALLSDQILFLSADPSVDPSWYTKRAALSMVYTTTELFMTNDRSGNFVDTAAFLRRRLNEVKTLSGTMGAVRQWVGFTVSAGVNVLRSKDVPM